MPQPRTFYVLECEASGGAVEFWLNDMPAARCGGEGLGRFYNLQANHLLVPGENLLTLVIGPGSRPSRSLLGDEPPPRARRTPEEPLSAQARLCRYPEGQLVGGPAAEPLIELSWELPETARRVPFPQVIAGAADLGPLFGPWEWQDAPQLTLDEETLGEVNTLLEDLRASLLAKEFETLFRLSRPRLDDLSRAFSLAPGAKEAEIEKTCRFYMELAGWGLDPLDPQAYDLRLCAGRRLIDCVRRDWEPVLREHPRPPEGLQNTWPLRLAYLEEGLRIVR